MKLTEIQELIRFVAKSGVEEVEIEQKDFKISIKAESKKKHQETVYIQQAPQQQQVAAPQQAAAPVAPASNDAAPKKEEAANSNLIEIKAQMIGTFYRKPTPEAKPFVEVGDSVKAGQEICIIEAMKLYNKIESEVSGKIVKVLVDDMSPVEFDHPLFLVDPS